MKYLLVFILFFNSFLYSNPRKSIDSLRYYKNLANANIKIDKFGNAIYYTQKALNYLEVNHKPKDLAKQTYKLGKLFYDIKKYDEAIYSLKKCISLYETLKPDFTKSFAYYYMGKASIEKKNYVLAGFCFDKEIGRAHV